MQVHRWALLRRRVELSQGTGTCNAGAYARANNSFSSPDCAGNCTAGYGTTVPRRPGSTRVAAWLVASKDGVAAWLVASKDGVAAWLVASKDGVAAWLVASNDGLAVSAFKAARACRSSDLIE